MKGSVKSKGVGSWELVFDVGRDQLTNKRRQRSRTFHGTKREAERELRRLISDAELGRLTGRETTVVDLIAKWLDLVSSDLSPTTLREYRRLVDKRIAPALGSISLTKLTTPRLDDFYQALSTEAKLSPSSVRQIHAIIRRFLKQGVKWGWIEHNAAVNASPPTLRHKEINPPPIELIRQLVQEAHDYDASFGVLVRLAIASGLRRSELCGLKWVDVDFDRAKLKVSRSVVAVPEGTKEKSTKTRSNRRLTLDAETFAMLATHRAFMERRAKENDVEVTGNGYMFSHALDALTPLHPDNVTRAFRELPSNNKTVRLHDLRHAHATQLLGKGVDIPTVAGRLGHAAPSTTLNFYAHVLDENDQTAADIMGELL